MSTETETTAPALPAATPAPPPELCITRKQFEALRGAAVAMLRITESQAESLGTVATGSPMIIREHLEGFATGRWLPAVVDEVDPPGEVGVVVRFASVGGGVAG